MARGGVVLARARGEPPDVVEHEENWPALQARRRRWAALLRRVFQVDVEVCARCGGEARIIGFVTEPEVIRRIVAQLERRGVDARPDRGWEWRRLRADGRASAR